MSTTSADWRLIRPCAGSSVAVAYNLATFLHCIDLSEAKEDWSPTSLQLRLIKIGARVVLHAGTITFQLAEDANEVLANGIFMKPLTGERSVGRLERKRHPRPRPTGSCMRASSVGDVAGAEQPAGRLVVARILR